MKIHCFGDSWAAGAELKSHEKPFVHWLADSLNLKYTNHGVSSSSLGIILKTIVKYLSRIDKGDIVTVIIPPDVRWYGQSGQRGFYSISMYDNTDHSEYYAFLQNKTTSWFIYHHALFIYSIQQLLKSRDCCYILAHNYGQLDKLNSTGFPIDFDAFLDVDNDLISLLIDNKHAWESYQLDNDGPMNLSDLSEYFYGCQAHPNEIGHKRIAELIQQKLQNIKPL